MSEQITIGSYKMQFDARQPDILQIIDTGTGQSMVFKAEEAYTLLRLLYEHNSELFQLAQQDIPEPPQLKELPAWALPGTEQE